MHTKLALSLCFLVIIGSAGGVQVWQTALDKSQLLQRGADLNPINGNSGNSILVTVNSQTYQEIYGFGGALTESSAINFMNLKQKDSGNYMKVLTSLFDPDSGAGFQILRIPMGSSDFSQSPFYTYDDVTNDWLFGQWSWNREVQYKIPVLKDILSINPNIKIMITPWTAPTWMKTSANASNAFYWGGLNANYFDDFAYYFQVTIQKYQSIGINIYALSLQNEPQSEPQPYPCMRMSAQDEIGLAQMVGQKLKTNNINTKILVWDHNWDQYEYPIQVLSDSGANPYVAGSAFHCYGGQVSAQSQVYNAFPDKEIWFTECSGTGDSNFAGNIPWNTQNLYMGSINNWARTVLHWNLALDTNAGPKADGGCSNCRGIITVESDSYSVTYNEEYWGMAQFSKFLKFPAHRLSCGFEGGWDCMYIICFQNADNSVVVVVGNFCQTPQSTDVQNQGSYVSLTVPVGLTTFVW